MLCAADDSAMMGGLWLKPLAGDWVTKRSRSRGERSGTSPAPLSGRSGGWRSAMVRTIYNIRSYSSTIARRLKSLLKRETTISRPKHGFREYDFGSTPISPHAYNGPGRSALLIRRKPPYRYGNGHFRISDSFGGSVGDTLGTTLREDCGVAQAYQIWPSHLCAALQIPATCKYLSSEPVHELVQIVG